MENNPKRKTDRTGNADRTDKTGKTGKTNTKARAGIGQKEDTAYDRLNKALKPYEKILAKTG